MKLSVWARQQGLCYKTAWRMWKDGKLPVPAEQLPTGTVIVHAEERQPSSVALYARVSSADQKGDLDRQLARLTEFALARRLSIVEAVKEVGSGMDGQRKGLLRLLRDPKIGTILVEHRDRLMRLGFEQVEAALAAQGRSVLVVDSEERTDDKVRDLEEVILSLGERLYGKSAANDRMKKALGALISKANLPPAPAGCA
ncbi:IS607 family transposase [Methylacidimicrobium sp. B4]|uniref:IS607 family transposase n=1 Tax=Methylacidimicrobium sp. B4 TaxID=2796139 RepID=UPI001A8F18EF|nr:IS607 family transposase [Methylacidimicrobium sp. B4]QSR84709.1 IS607 family transposase [Methylacidimicrobium sp. B4]